MCCRIALLCGFVFINIYIIIQALILLSASNVLMSVIVDVDRERIFYCVLDKQL